MQSKAKRIRTLMADSGVSRAEAKAWIELEGDDEPEIEQLFEGKPYPHFDTKQEHDA